MKRKEFVTAVSNAIRHIRVNQNLTQDKMAEVLGISKKTLVQVEKGRNTAGWTVAVACCAIFRHDESLQGVLGGEPMELVDLFSAQSADVPGVRTMGGKVCWREIVSEGGYVVQQNIISQHFRILDREHGRWFSSFDLDETMQRMEELVKGAAE